MFDVSELLHVFFLIAALVGVTTGFLYLRYRTSIAQWGAGLLLAVSANLACYSMIWIADSLAGKITWLIAQAIYFYIIPGIWLFFISKFQPNSQLYSKPLFVIPFFLPALAFPFLVLQQIRGLEFSVFLLNSSFTALNLQPLLGEWAIFYWVFFLVVILIASFLAMKLSITVKDRESRSLLHPITAASIFVIPISVLDMLNIPGIGQISITQIGLALLCFVFFVYVRIYRFGGIIPIGRENVFEVMREGCILLDEKNRIIDVNNEAQQFLELKRNSLLQKKISEVWVEISDLMKSLPHEKLIVKEISKDNSPFGIRYQISILQLCGINNIKMGSLISIRNNSDRDLLEKTIRQQDWIRERNSQVFRLLVETNLQFQSTLDLSGIYSSTNALLENLDLGCFVLKKDAVTEILHLDHVSLNPDQNRRIEKLLGIPITGIPFDREDYPDIYLHLETDEADFLKTSWHDPSSSESKPAAIFLSSLQALGAEFSSPMVVFRLAVAEKEMGLIAIWGKEISEDILIPLRIFSTQLAWAIERVALSQFETKRTAELMRSNVLVSALARISAEIGKSMEISRTLDTLGRELEALGLHCIYGTVDEAIEVVTLRYASFLEKIKKYEKFIPGAGLIGYQLPQNLWPGTRGLKLGIPTWYQNIYSIFYRMFPTIPEKILNAALQQAGISEEESLCILPLLINGKSVGVLPIWGKGIQEQDSPYLVVFSHQVAQLIQMAENYEVQINRSNELTRSNNLISALSNVAVKMGKSSTLAEVYETLGVEMQKIELNCMIGTLDPEKQNLKIDYLSIPQEIIKWVLDLGITWPREIRIPRQLWPTEIAVTEKTPFWDKDSIKSAGKMFPFIPNKLFVKAFETFRMSPDDPVCYLPLLVEEDVIGILAVWGPRLKVNDIRGLNLFANQVATSIRKITLYTEAQQEILARKKVEKQIRAALDEKEILLKEVHHRVKNNLQIISSLLNLQIGQTTDLGKVSVLRESQNRVRAMALIHEKLYQSEDLNHINFAQYVKSLTDFLHHTYNTQPEQVTIQLDIEDIKLDLDLAIPCGLILNELIANALKYAFPDNRPGKIDISCHRIEEGSFLLQVSDNGIGFPENINVAKAQTLGMKLVTSLVRQIDGSLEVDGKNGACYRIRFSQNRQ